MTTTKNLTKEECFLGWARQGLHAMAYLKNNPDDEKAWVYVRVSAACCAELDRKHKREETQILQEYVWERGFLTGETSYERYEQSGYFKEEYRKVA